MVNFEHISNYCDASTRGANCKLDRALELASCAASCVCAQRNIRQQREFYWPRDPAAWKQGAGWNELHKLEATTYFSRAARRVHSKHTQREHGHDMTCCLRHQDGSAARLLAALALSNYCGDKYKSADLLTAINLWSRGHRSDAKNLWPRRQRRAHSLSLSLSQVSSRARELWERKYKKGSLVQRIF
jgi:hypothetical protein